MRPLYWSNSDTMSFCDNNSMALEVTKSAETTVISWMLHMVETMKGPRSHNPQTALALHRHARLATGHRTTHLVLRMAIQVPLSSLTTPVARIRSVCAPNPATAPKHTRIDL